MSNVCSQLQILRLNYVSIYIGLDSVFHRRLVHTIWDTQNYNQTVSPVLGYRINGSGIKKQGLNDIPICYNNLAKFY